ncbi:MAG: hypothetical protein QM687_00370 [Ferruginibacter sp.]
MIKTLEERKKDYIAYVNEEYRPKPRRRWQTVNEEYITTKEAAEKSRYSPGASEETEIKYNLKRALLYGALFFITSVGITCWNYIKKSKVDISSIIFTTIFLLLISGNIIRQINPRVKIKMNNQFLWLHTINEWINWKDLVAAYIKKDNSGESPVYYLVIHFYTEANDRFFFTEIALDELDLRKEDIAAEIEYRRIMARPMYVDLT